MKYCAFCGKELNDTEKCTCADAVQKNNSQKKLITLGAIAAAVIALAIILVFILTGGNKVDATDYYIISIKGYDGNGEISAAFDGMALAKLITDGEKEILAYTDERYDEWMTILQDISCKFDKSEGLSNGDVVTMTVTVKGETAKRFKGGSTKIKIEDLPFIETEDVFENISVEFSGMNGDGLANILVNSDDEFYNGLSFSLINCTSGELSNGDVIEIKVTYPEGWIEEYQRAPQETKKTYTVSGLGQYVTIDTLPMGIIDSFANQFIAEEQAENDNEQSSIFSYEDVKLYAIYFSEVKEDVFSLNRNQLDIVVYCEEYMDGEYWRTVYLPLAFKDLAFNPDGKLNVEYDDGAGTGTFYTEPEAYREHLEEKFNVTKIK